MATFAPETPVQPGQPYFWAKPTSEPKPDISGELKGKAVGDALKSGASAIRDGVQGITAAYEKGIQNTIYAGVDPLRDQYMERLHSTDQILQGHETPDPLGRDAPRDVKGLPNTLGTLDSARANGKLSQTDYDARLNALAKEVRAKYPGYREYVDETFKRITGRDSANQYIKSVIGDVDSFISARKGEQSKIENKLMGEWNKFSGADVWLQRYKENPDKYGPAILRWANDNESKDHALEMSEKLVNYMKSTDSLNRERETDTRNKAVTDSATPFYNSKLDTIEAHLNIDPKTNERMQEALHQIHRGERVTNLSEEDKVVLRTFLQQQWAGISSERAADLRRIPGMKEEEVEKIIQGEFKSSYEPWMDALGKGDYSLAAMQKNLIHAQGLDAIKPYFDKGKYANTFKFLQGLGVVDSPLKGQFAIQMGVQAGPEIAGEFATAAAAAATPPSDPNHKPLGQTAQELRIKNAVDGRLWKSLIEFHALPGVKGKQAISDDHATALIQSAFGPKSGDLLSYFSAQSSARGLGQQWVFDTLASNGMIDRTAKLAKEKPELYNHLKDFAANNIKYLVNKDLLTPNNPRYSGVRVDYDADAHSFSFKEPTVRGAVHDPYRTRALASLKANMDRMITISEKDPNQHINPTVDLYRLLKTMGTQDGSLVNNMIKAIEAAHK